MSATASKSPSVLLSLDISAAFDTLDHLRLHYRVKGLFGFDSSVLQWLGSYLVGGEQFVGVASCHSRTVKLFSGVLQGSFLGPLLFSIFTTPVGNLISTFEIRYHQISDDTQLYMVIDTTSPTGLATLSARADAVAGWHIRDDVILDPTRQTASSLARVKKWQSLACQSVGGAAVLFGSTHRVRGVTLDSEHTFDQHITVVVRAYNCHLRALRHIRHLIDREAANTIAFSIICSRLDYCSAILYLVNEGNIDRQMLKILTSRKW